MKNVFRYVELSDQLFKSSLQKVYQHTAGKCLIHGI